ncbi:hypothetical protein ASL14_19210 [Paenibacillus sp. IHB B 3084]|uniref:hypothetical protein n=1 Tax=Paenibacillus sp. IHB B 3084 TaxID=867076 RepID=UPI00071F7116|nr:hypothetical protein [Paenibacillus sp. IHB B 3084]ALP38000.1 hypothetical protein ASL14_19210 [Paenibacillus sp. IHB B 3084]
MEQSIIREVPTYPGHIHMGRYRSPSDIQYQVTTFSTDGESFTKHYQIPQGEFEVYATGEKGRFMIRLDEPLVAINEGEAPFSSKLYRMFVSKEELALWSFATK